MAKQAQTTTVRRKARKISFFSGRKEQNWNTGTRNTKRLNNKTFICSKWSDILDDDNNNSTASRRSFAANKTCLCPCICPFFFFSPISGTWAGLMFIKGRDISVSSFAVAEQAETIPYYVIEKSERGTYISLPS